jgi:hypothetical protein
MAFGKHESRQLSRAWTIEGWLYGAALIAVRSAAAERIALRIGLATQ